VSRRSRAVGVVLVLVAGAVLAAILVGVGGAGTGNTAASGSASPSPRVLASGPGASRRTSVASPARTAGPRATATPRSSATPSPAPAVTLPLRVELWGDSISGQAAPNIAFVLGESHKVISRLHTFGGSALCDWFQDMRNELNPANPDAFHPQVAVIQFSGDAFTPCMHDANGVAYSGQALVNKYALDSGLVIALFGKAKIPVYFVSTPVSAGQARQGYVGLLPIDAMFSTLPARYPAGHIARYIDGASPLEWHGRYSATLPCLPWETCTGHWPDGTKTVVVRQADGTHFCPVTETVNPDGSKTCPVFMPGAQRFATAIAASIFRDFRL
jgi:hypothetical protein